MKKENIHNITSSGFKTPANYFESLDAQILERLADKEMISGIDNPGFTVPKDYFDSVESMVFEKLTAQPEQPVITLKPRRTFYYVAGIAASLVLLVSLVFNNTNDSLSINTIDTASIENYLYQEDYSYDDLANLLQTDYMSETDFIDINISDDYIDQYIDNIDPEDLNLD